MREIIIDIPLEKQNFDDELFEYKSFKKARKISQAYQGKLKSAFAHNFVSSAPTFKPQGSVLKKNVVIKNIGNMKKAHLSNALNYTIEKSFQTYNNLFGEGEENSLESLLGEGERCGIDELGNFVGVQDILSNWQEDFSTNPKTNEALHLVFSLNEVKSDSLMDILLESTKATMQSNFGEYKYILVPHAHQNQPHIHIIVNKTNIFSRKKLHFESKSACANFYDALREDFKQNLFVLSNGKLDYTNEVRFDKNFRQAHIDSKIQALESFEADFQEWESDVAFLASYKNAIASVSAKKQFYATQKSTLHKEIKHTSIYLHNVEKKLAKLKSETKDNFTFSKLENTKLNLLNKLVHLGKDYAQANEHIQRLDSHIARFLDWEDTYKSFCKNFTLYNKKKSLVDTFKGYEQYLPSSLVAKLTLLKRDVARFSQTITDNIKEINDGINAGLMDNNKKTNAFKLSKRLSKLLYYKNIISSIDFSQNKSVGHKRDMALQSLEDSKNTLLELMRQRFSFVSNELTQSRKLFAQMQNITNLETKDIDSLPTLVQLEKKIGFLSKECHIAKEVLAKHNIALPLSDQEAVPFESASAHSQGIRSAAQARDSLHTESNAHTKHKVAHKHK